MKVVLKRLVRDEKGAALVLTLVLLLIGGLIMAPLLGFMGTGIIAGEVHEKRMDELYAADAGVEDAMWNIQLKTDKVAGLTQCNQSTNYTITGVNGKTVDVTITLMTIVDDVPCDYRVVSTATSDDSATEIEAYIVGESKYDDYSDILENVLTSQDEINLKPGTNITPLEGEHSPAEYYGDIWPALEELKEFYAGNVTGGTHYYEDTEIDLDGVDMDLGPLYVDGELDIVNSSDTPATVTLTGTIYVTGDTQIYGPTANEPLKLTLDLNGQTIFVASNTTGAHNALEIQKCNIIGTGIIIAIGDIYFAPKTEAGMTDPIFIMSVLGETLVQPNGDFYGSIAGSVEVDLQPNTSLNYPDDEGWYGDLNFLIGVQELVHTIASWTATTLTL